MKAATALQLLPHRITSGAEAMKLDGIGKKIGKKIDEILQTGKLQKLEKAKADPRVQAINQLCKITGIG
jgi:DNA polymerase beta